MKFWKILILTLIAALAVASVYAANVKMDVYPSNNAAEPNEDFVVFGYVYDSASIDDSNIKLKVYDDDGNLIDSYTPRFHTLSGNEPSREGYFYSSIDINSYGDYDLKLKIDGTTEASQSISIESMNDREVKINDFDAYISGNNIVFNIEVENRDNDDHEVKIYLQGENNFKSPKTFTIDLDAGEKEDVRKTYSVSEFGNHDFMVVAQAKTDSGSKESYSTAKYVFLEADYSYDYYDYNYDYTYSEPVYYNYPAYGYGNLVITDIKLDTAVFYPGDIVEGKVYITNVGSHESQYRFEYVYGNTAYKMGDVGYVMPKETDVQDIVIEIPDAETLKLTAKVISGVTETEERTYLVSQKIKYFSPVLSQNELYVDAGENAAVNITLKNRGNEDDTYSIDVNGWDFYKVQTSAFVKAGSQETVELVFEVPESSKVGKYPIVLDIVNSNGVHRSETVQLAVIKSEAEQSGVVFEDKIENHYFEEGETISYALTVTNKELDDKDYFVEVDADNADVAIEPESFKLEYEGSRQVEISVTPAENKDHNVDIKVYANGERIFKNAVPIEYTENKQRQISGLTGFAIWEGQPWMPGIYMLALIGLISLGYMGYRFVNEKKKTEQIVKYNVQKPIQPASANQNTAAGTPPQQYSQWTVPRNPQAPRNDYPEDSFMKRF